ncbi:MAG: hypothetical protein ACKO7Z_04360, partial [Cyanobacteriota bacterium]
MKNHLKPPILTEAPQAGSSGREQESPGSKAVEQGNQSSRIKPKERFNAFGPPQEVWTATPSRLTADPERRSLRRRLGDAEQVAPELVQVLRAQLEDLTSKLNTANLNNSQLHDLNQGLEQHRQELERQYQEVERQRQELEHNLQQSHQEQQQLRGETTEQAGQLVALG